MADPDSRARILAGADLYARRFGLARLHVLGASGEPIATFVRRAGALTIHPPIRRAGEPAANLALLAFLGSRASRSAQA